MTWITTSPCDYQVTCTFTVNFTEDAQTTYGVPAVWHPSPSILVFELPCSKPQSGARAMPMLGDIFQQSVFSSQDEYEADRDSQAIAVATGSLNGWVSDAEAFQIAGVSVVDSVSYTITSITRTDVTAPVTTMTTVFPAS